MKTTAHDAFSQRDAVACKAWLCVALGLGCSPMICACDTVGEDVTESPVALRQAVPVQANACLAWCRRGAAAQDDDIEADRSVAVQPATSAVQPKLKTDADDIEDVAPVGCLCSPVPAAAQSGVVFPADSGIVDVTKAPYFAKGDGVFDDTAAIQAALSDHPNGNRIIYLPEGIYRVTDTLRWAAGTGPGNRYKRTILQGQGRDRSIIYLPAATAGYRDASQPKAVVFTGSGPAQRFRNAVRDLTVRVGADNPGAIGVQFMANNQGTVRDLRIVSEDGQGVYGLDLGHSDEVGPLLVKNVDIEGFDIGARTRFQVNSATYEDIRLKGQNQFGLVNWGQKVFVRGLVSDNEVTAVFNRGNSNGLLTLVDATLTGTGPLAAGRPAVLNGKGLYARNVQTTGYELAVQNSDKGREWGDMPAGLVAEHHAYLGPEPYTLFASRDPRVSNQRSLHLPALPTPTVDWGDVDRDWVSVVDYGASLNGGDDTQAVQAAIDSGARTVYFPAGGWFDLDGEIVVRGNVERLIGLEGRLRGDGQIRIADATPPVVILERLDMRGTLTVVHDTQRTVVLAHSTLGDPSYRNTVTGGTLFLEDVVGADFVFRGQRVYARQINVENNGTHIRNDGGTLWIFGYKTEKNGIMLETLNSGQSELIGTLFFFNNGGNIDVPVLRSVDSEVSYAGIGSAKFVGPGSNVWVEELRLGESRVLTPADFRVGGRGGIWFVGR